MDTSNRASSPFSALAIVVENVERLLAIRSSRVEPEAGEAESDSVVWHVRAKYTTPPLPSMQA